LREGKPCNAAPYADLFRGLYPFFHVLVRHVGMPLSVSFRLTPTAIKKNPCGFFPL
jgi:hypothetical protein